MPFHPYLRVGLHPRRPRLRPSRRPPYPSPQIQQSRPWRPPTRPASLPRRLHRRALHSRRSTRPKFRPSRSSPGEDGFPSSPGPRDRSLPTPSPSRPRAGPSTPRARGRLRAWNGARGARRERTRRGRSRTKPMRPEPARRPTAVSPGQAARALPWRSPCCRRFSRREVRRQPPGAPEEGCGRAFSLSSRLRQADERAPNPARRTPPPARRSGARRAATFGLRPRRCSGLGTGCHRLPRSRPGRSGRSQAELRRGYETRSKGTDAARSSRRLLPRWARDAFFERPFVLARRLTHTRFSPDRRPSGEQRLRRCADAHPGQGTRAPGYLHVSLPSGIDGSRCVHCTSHAQYAHE